MAFLRSVLHMLWMLVTVVPAVATVAPSVKCTLSTVPATRGRSSTNSAASMRPLKVSRSVTGRWVAGATLTGMAGGGPPWASAGLPQAARKGRVARAATARNRVGFMERTGMGGCSCVAKTFTSAHRVRCAAAHKNVD